MDFLQLDVAQRHTVRDAIVREWRRRQAGRYLPRPGLWHVCDAGTCRMVQLSCDVVLDANETVRFVAAGDGHVRVRNLFVCWETGKVHTCSDACSRNAAGACRLTGHACQSAVLPQLNGDSSEVPLCSAAPKQTREDEPTGPRRRVDTATHSSFHSTHLAQCGRRI